MKKLLLTLALTAALIAPAKADDVGAVIGGLSGLFIAGPPGAIIGLIVGGIWGKPFWGPDESEYKCWIDREFVRHCPKLPVAR